MLNKIQQETKVPKNQYNSFGKYKYRSCEDILEAVKPILEKYGFYLILTDEIFFLGNRFYIKSTATISNGSECYTATAYAREEDNKKGMDACQITGTSSSYARKYALCGLFAIDDTKDSDATNTHDTKPEFNEQSPKFKEAHKAISEGTYTIEDLQKKYYLSEKTIEKLTSKFIQ